MAALGMRGISGQTPITWFWFSPIPRSGSCAGEARRRQHLDLDPYSCPLSLKAESPSLSNKVQPHPTSPSLPRNAFPEGFLVRKGPGWYFSPPHNHGPSHAKPKDFPEQSRAQSYLFSKILFPSLVDHYRHCGWDCFEFIKCLLQ